MKQVLEYIKKYAIIKEKDRIIIGVSGGADSVCLLHMLVQVRELYDLTLCAVHVHHGLRGEEADEDANFVTNLCERWNVACRVIYVDMPRYAKEQKLSMEEAGRVLRYKAFEDEYKQGNYNKIAVAHNKNDQVETVLMNMTRGTGMKGLAGMLPVRDCIIRPILCLTREAIERYLQENQLEYRVDSTNLQEIYTRNKLRRNVIPALVAVNQQAIEHIAQCSEQLGEIEQYLLEQTNLAYEKVVSNHEGEYFLDIERFGREDLVIQKRLLRTVLEQLAGKLQNIEKKHIEGILELVSKEVGKRLNLPYKIVVTKEYKKLTIVKKEEKNSYNQKLMVDVKGPGEYDNIITNKRVKLTIFPYQKKEKIPKNEYTKWFDYDKIENSIVFRNRILGDYMQINKQGNTKKLKSLFIDQKIPQKQRDEVVLLCDGNHVIWVVGGRISEAYKITDDTKKVLEVKVMEV